ncbi:MAG: ABC transporter ATP-binding protein/permease [Propionibacteriaceae bacterium]|nr:ABC transporter ATP-binding protein/permease [Propionibacteriaceae bacterium]
MVKLFAKFLKPYRWLLLAVIGLQLVQAMASLLLPSLNASIIDDGVAKQNFAHIWTFGAFMLGVSILQVAGQISVTWCGSRAAMGFGRDLRQAVFDSAINFSRREMGEFGAPSLITRSTNDVQQVQQFVLMSAVVIVSAPLVMIGGVVMALREDPGLSWLIVAAVFALGVVISVLVVQMTPLFKQMQIRIDNLNRVLREQISGLRVIRAFTTEPTEAARFDRANRDYVKTALAVGARMMTMFPTVFLIMNLTQVAVIWFGAGRINQGDLQVGQLTAYLSYLMQILMSVMMASVMLMIGPRAAVTAGRIKEVLETNSSVVPPENPVTELRAHSVVEFSDVEFRYPGAAEPVIRQITFTAKPGTTTAIIGATGAGKTTLVNLIPRLYDVSAGRVLVDGVDVRELDQDLLWAQIGIVPQQPYLFSGTIASNLRMGNPDASDDELWQALDVAQATEFVSKLADGLEAPIAQGGTNVSGGQRQRLAIARALVRKPEIYIFDDSFSALDVATDAQVRAGLAETTKDAAVIVVAQRVSTIRDADQIVVLEEGTICGIGTHEWLLENNPTYAEIVESQFQTEEAPA